MEQTFLFEIGQIPDDRLKYAVIAARHKDQWIFCRHRERQSWEIPGGHRQPGETMEEAARRELWEETGADVFSLYPLCAYGVNGEGGWGYGLLYAAKVKSFTHLPPMEIAEIRLGGRLPDLLTYPQIQPALWQRADEWFRRHP